MADPSMKLPPGKTCADCVHLNRCVAFGFTKPERVTCDFAPSRFRDMFAVLRQPKVAP